MEKRNKEYEELQTQRDIIEKKLQKINIEKNRQENEKNIKLFEKEREKGCNYCGNEFAEDDNSMYKYDVNRFICYQCKNKLFICCDASYRFHSICIDCRVKNRINTRSKIKPEQTL